MTIGSNLPPLTAMPQGAGFADEAQGGRPAFFSGAAVQFMAGKTSTVEGVDPTVEADITTNDALGLQFSAAFNLPAPAVPEGLKG